VVFYDPEPGFLTRQKKIEKPGNLSCGSGNYMFFVCHGK
jgi:hypothetical protein